MDNQPHVLIALPWYKPAVGGVVHGVSRLVERLPSRGVRVTLLLQAPFNVPTPLTKDGEAEIFGFNTRMPLVDNHRLKSAGGFVSHFLPTIHTLRSFMQERGINVVNVHFPSGQYYYFAWLKKHHGFPLVVSLHGSDVRLHFDSGGPNRWALTSLLRSADRVTAVSEELLEKARSKVRGLRTTTAPIYGGADAEFFDMAQAAPSYGSRPYIVCVGRLHPVKGHDTLLQAFRWVKDKNQTNCQLYLAGGGELESVIRKRVQDLGLENDVVMLGMVDRSKLPRLNRDSLFSVLASRSEGLPLTILESFATERTVVATNVGGIQEIVVDGVNGLLVPPDDPAALADRMLWLLSHPDKCQEFGRAARRTVEQGFDWDANADTFAKMYDELVKGTT